jgi:uncharacterized protein (TIGR03083 family)
MEQPGRDQFFAEISDSAARLADVVRTHDPDLPVPTCPAWTLRQLATHLGRVHRWAAEIVSTRSAEYIPFDSVPDGRYPAGAADRAAWLTAGADRVIAAVAGAGDAPVWAFGRLAPATFWARRQSHETMVHRADAELAIGGDVVLDAGLAADGIDEWLTMVTRSRRQGDGSAALPPGAALRVQVRGSGRSWRVANGPAGLAMERGLESTGGPDQDGRDAVTVSGPAGPLLLVLVRRRSAADEQSVTVAGDGALLQGWLAGTPF